MVKKEKEAVKVVSTARPVEQSSSVDSLITQAIEHNAPIETMERLLAMRKELRSEQAKEAFVLAMANFQANCPVIEKTKKVLNKDGISVRYKYAPIDSIVEQIKEPLANAGLAYTFTVTQDDKFLVAKAVITHTMGHSESSEFRVPTDSEGYMTVPQKVASALTFAKRYALCNALGISTGDEDTDATDVKKEPEAKSPKSKIVFLLRKLAIDTSTKESNVRAVKSLTDLDLVPENYETIIERLEIIINEANEDPNVQ